MIETKGSIIIALAVAVMVAVAAVAVGLVLSNNGGSNPDPVPPGPGPGPGPGPEPEPETGIEGTYYVTDYTEYGTLDGVTPAYIDSDDAPYSPYESGYVKITSHDESTGIVKGYGHFGDSYPFIGYYEPSTHAFGYGCSYNLPISKDTTVKAIDYVNGSIYGNSTMYVRGYTISNDDSKITLAFSITLVKKDATPVPETFRNVITAEFTSYMRYSMNVDNGVPKYVSIPGPFSVKPSEGGFRYGDGVYALSINGKDAAGVILYQSGGITYIKAMTFRDGDAPIEVFWICVNGNRMFITGSNASGESACEYCFLVKNGATYDGAPFDFEKKTREWEFDTWDSKESSYSSDAEFKDMFNGTIVTPMNSFNEWTFVMSFPYGGFVAFNGMSNFGGSSCYSDMLGYINQRTGDISTYGFMYDTEGNVKVSIGTMSVQS